MLGADRQDNPGIVEEERTWNKMTEMFEVTPTEPEYDVSKDAVRKWLLELGTGVERTCRLLNSNDGKRHHIYEWRIKEKLGASAGVLVMLKAYGDNGPLIAFHQDSSHLQAIMNIGNRSANGSLDFVPDAYPPKDYDKAVVEYLARIEYFNK